MERGFLLLEDKPAEKTTGWPSLLKRTTAVKALKGELLNIIPDDQLVPRSDGTKPHNYRLVTDETITLRAEEEHVAPLWDHEFLLLEAIESRIDRYQVFSSEKLEWGTKLKPGDAVYVTISGRTNASSMIRYVGETPNNLGLLFGVEIMDKSYFGRGTTDGTFQAKRYFSCKDNCGLFVALDKIFTDSSPGPITIPPKRGANQQSSHLSSQSKSNTSDARESSTDARESSTDPQPQFFIGDRVVVYNKKGAAVYGTVRWTGQIQGEVRPFAVGIETDISVRKEDFTDALTFKSQQFRVSDHRHGKVYLLEAFVTPAEQRSPSSSFNTRHPVKLAKTYGFDSTADMMKEQSAAMQQAEGIKEAKELEEIQKAVSTQQIDVGAQIEALRDIEQKQKEATAKAAATWNQSPPSGGSTSGVNDQRNLQRHVSHQGDYPHSGHPQQPSHDGLAAHPGFGKQPSYHTYEAIPGQPGGRYGNARGVQGFDQTLQQHHYPSQHGPPQSTSQSQLHEPPPVQVWSSLGVSHPNTQSNVPSQKSNLGVGSTVQVSDPPRYGVIRWIGPIQGISGSFAGIELEEVMEGCEDGTWRGTRYFWCAPGRGFICPYATLKPDQRFNEGVSATTSAPVMNPLDSQPLQERLDQHIGHDQISKYIGEECGIQGHQNSCYLDATVFGLFALSDAFDSMFLNTAKNLDGEAISGLLWKGIVNPLRKNGVVRYESVMKLRNKLEELGKMKGVNQDEKDPEEFLNMLFKHTLNVEPFIGIKRPFGIEQEFFVQLFLEADESLKLPPTVGQLLNKMFKEQNILFTRVPSKLLIQIPRFGRQFKTYKKVIPALHLDVMDLIASPHNCFICEKSAWNKCLGMECTQQFVNPGSETHVFFCDSCCKTVHTHSKRSSHQIIRCDSEHEQYGVTELDLLSVICIETSHYVCFTRSAAQNRWMFFDSMANRVHDKYNIPKGVDCTRELNEWVYCEDLRRLQETPSRELPEYVRRFTQDIYLCVYIQPDLILYGE